MAFDLEIPEPEEVKAKVEQELAVPEERAQVIDNVAQAKGEEILAVDLDSVHARFVRDIEPGEILVFTKDGIRCAGGDQ